MNSGDDGGLDLAEHDRAFWRPIALQLLRGEFDAGDSAKLKVFAELLGEVDCRFCQRAAGYVHCLLESRKTKTKEGEL